MIQDGLDPWFHASELSVRGYLEVIRHLPRILKIRREMMRRTIQFRPAAYIGVDAPDFNLSIEEKVELRVFRSFTWWLQPSGLGVRREFTKSNVRWIICF